ncbi:MAG: hypothetical protein WBW61_06285 [Rhodanobacteraceae bacterium]
MSTCVSAGLALVLVAASASARAQTDSMQTSGDATHTTTYQTANGPLIVNWGQPAAQPAGPAPDFAQLDRNGDGRISQDEAAGYPLLADDYIHADRNRDGSVSKSEYVHWTSEQ